MGMHGLVQDVIELHEDREMWKRKCQRLSSLLKAGLGANGMRNLKNGDIPNVYLEMFQEQQREVYNIIENALEEKLCTG